MEGVKELRMIKKARRQGHEEGRKEESLACR